MLPGRGCLLLSGRGFLLLSVQGPPLLPVQRPVLVLLVPAPLLVLVAGWSAAACPRAQAHDLLLPLDGEKGPLPI
jgi:hypothetical protein